MLPSGDVPLALEVEVATIRLRFGGGHGRRRRRIGLQYRKSLANQLAPRYARNSAATPLVSLPLSFSASRPLSISPYLLLPLSLSHPLNLQPPSYCPHVHVIE